MIQNELSANVSVNDNPENAKPSTEPKSRTSTARIQANGKIQKPEQSIVSPLSLQASKVKSIKNGIQFSSKNSKNETKTFVNPSTTVKALIKRQKEPRKLAKKDEIERILNCEPTAWYDILGFPADGNNVESSERFQR